MAATAADKKTITKHYWTAKEARESLESALAQYEELDPAVAYTWDGLTDTKTAIKEALRRAKETEAIYQKEL